MSTKIKKSEVLQVRISITELAASKSRALKYFNGDHSKWVRYCLDNCKPPKKK